MVQMRRYVDTRNEVPEDDPDIHRGTAPFWSGPPLQKVFWFSNCACLLRPVS